MLQIKQRKQKATWIPLRLIASSRTYPAYCQRGLVLGRTGFFQHTSFKYSFEKRFLIAGRVKRQSKGVYRYLLRGFPKVENCSTIEKASINPHPPPQKKKSLLSLIQKVSLMRPILLLRASRNSTRVSSGPH